MKTLLFFLFLSSIPYSFGQTVLFSEDFESGTLNTFTASGQLNSFTWQTTTNRGSDPGHSASNSAYFGDAASFNYNSGNQEFAYLTSTAIDVSTQTNLTLDFNYFLETQNSTSFDVAYVQVSKNGTDFYTLIDNGTQGGLTETNGNWKHIELDIKQFAGSSYGGTNLYLRIVFNTFDGNYNNFEGFYIDDITVSSNASILYSHVGTTSSTAEYETTASIKTQDGNIVKAFNQTSLINISYGFGLVKTDALNGNELWRQKIYGTPTTSRSSIKDLKELNNGNLVFVGHAIKGPSTVHTPYFGVTNSDASNVISTQMLVNSSGNEIDGDFNAVTQLNNNNIVMVGVAWDNTDLSGPGDAWGSSNFPSYQPMITIITPTGNIVSSKITRLYNMRSSEFTDVKPTSDGGFIVIGNSMENLYNYKTPFIIKYDAAGTLVWRKNYGLSVDFDAVLVKPNDSIIVFADNNNSQNYVIGLNALGQGNVVGNFSAYSPGLKREINAASFTSDGGIVATGIAEHSQKDSCLVALKLSSNYTLEWVSVYGGYSHDVGTGIHELADKSIFVSGFSTSFNTNNRKQEYELKLDSLGKGEACLVDLDFGTLISSNGLPGIENWTDSLIVETSNYLPTLSFTSTSVTSAFPVNDNNFPTVTNSAMPLSCFGDQGDINLAVSASNGGGVAPYSYFWSNGSASPTLFNVIAKNYTYEVTDANGCLVRDSVFVVQPLPISTNISVTNPQCNGGLDGAIDLTVMGGLGNLTYQWTNNLTTEDLSNISAGFYQVTVLDANSCTATASASVIEPTALNVSITNFNNVTCNGACDGSVTALATGGTSPYTYQWSGGNTSTTPTISNLCPSTYLVTATDAHNCLAYENAIITEPDPLQYSFTTTGSECGFDNGSAQVQATGGVQPYTFNWSTGATGNSVTGLASGSYSLSGQDANGCANSGNFTIDPLTQGVQICIITVDTTSQHNFVVWEKPVSTTIAGFKVYRNVSGSYDEVGYVPYADLSEFKDNTFGVNPNTTSYRYKISVIDTCGYESDLSPYHETIHVTSSVGLGGEVNLIWDNYEGFPFVNYKILKDTTDNGINDFYEEDQVSDISFTWTDQNPQDFVVYAIEVLPPSMCTSTKANDWNSTRSNKTSKTSSVNGVIENDIEASSLSIYPNPNRGEFVVSFKSINTKPISYEIYDYTGQLILNNVFTPQMGANTINVNLTTLASGVYTVRLISGTNLITKKFIVSQ